MIKSVTVNINEITDNNKNPTLCLSAKRYTGHCASCTQFKNKFRKYKTIEETLKHLECKPIITDELKKLIDRKTELKEKLEKIKQQINNIDAEIEE